MTMEEREQWLKDRGVKIREPDSLRREAVDVGRLHLGGAVAADVRVAEIVGQQEDDVGRPRASFRLELRLELRRGGLLDQCGERFELTEVERVSEEPPCRAGVCKARTESRCEGA